MQCSRLYQSTLFVVAVLLTLTLAGITMPAQAAEGQAKVDRLIMGLIYPFRDYFRPWINGTPDHNIQHDPVMEWLIEIDPSHGAGHLPISLYAHAFAPGDSTRMLW